MQTQVRECKNTCEMSLTAMQLYSPPGCLVDQRATQKGSSWNQDLGGYLIPPGVDKVYVASRKEIVGKWKWSPNGIVFLKYMNKVHVSGLVWISVLLHFWCIFCVKPRKVPQEYATPWLLQSVLLWNADRDANICKCSPKIQQKPLGKSCLHPGFGALSPFKFQSALTYFLDAQNCCFRWKLCHFALVIICQLVEIFYCTCCLFTKKCCHLPFLRNLQICSGNG